MSLFLAIDATSQGPLPSAEDIRARIPPQGIRVGELMKFYKGQIVGDERKSQFTKLMKENSRFDRDSKLLKPL